MGESEDGLRRDGVEVGMMLKVGDYIRARNKKDFEQIMHELNKAGYGAVRTHDRLYEVCITSVPEEEPCGK